MPEPQTKVDDRPQATMQDKQNTVQELLRFALGNNAAKLTVDEDDNISLKTNYAPTQARNLEAQTQATQQAGLPSYGGIDAKDVLALMGQRGQQDARMAGQTGRDMQGMYQGALTQQILGDPQRREQDIRANLVIKMMAERAATERTKQMGANTIAAREVPQAQTSATQSSLLGGARQSNEMANWLAGGGKDAPIKLRQEQAKQKGIDTSSAWLSQIKKDSNWDDVVNYNENASPYTTIGVAYDDTKYGDGLSDIPYTEIVMPAPLKIVRQFALQQGYSDTTAMLNDIVRNTPDGRSPSDTLYAAMFKNTKVGTR